MTVAVTVTQAQRSTIASFKSEEEMTLLNKTKLKPVVQNKAPEELRVLAGLTLKKRLLRAELAEVESHCRQLAREIELKGIPIPWLT